MSNYEKLIKQATKPKAGAPKAKYIDPIIAASFSQDGSMQEICRAMAGRLVDPSSFVVFKTLIVIHTLIRNGGIENVMTHLAGNQGSLKLRNVVAGGNWQGYDAPKMLAHYAAYIDERIKAYRDLRRDPIRTSESGRGARASSEGAGSGHRLRRLTVDKGLLREVGVTQKVCSRLLDLFFSYFSDNTQEEMSLTAFRMSLKDLLALYAAINEGVINILEHYFEMAKTDAGKALDIYKRFCSHTEKIVAYLASAKKISFALNVPIPNLRHAPVSLAGALKEYLDDPNFEKNRLEYKENKRIADTGDTPAPKPEVKKEEGKKNSITIKEPTSEEKAKPVKPPTSNQALQDFFESIETDQMSMFGGAQQQQMQPYMTGMPQMMMPQQTGYNPFMNGMNGNGFMMPQQTGFMQPQQTGFIPPQQSSFMQPHQTESFLQPQMTGFNPFRQSVMMQPTGMNGFNSNFQTSSSALSPSTSAVPASNSSFAPATSTSISTAASQPPTRSASTPIKPLTAQKTGSRNPFAPPPGETPPPTPPPPGVKGPTLRDLAMGGMGSTQGPSAGGGGNYGLGAGAWNGNTNGQQQQSSQLMPQKTGLIGSVASEFVKGPLNSNGNGAMTPQQGPSSSSSVQSPAQTIGNDFDSAFSSMNLQSNQPLTSQAPLQPQSTGFGGVKPFQPASSFGASLLSPQPPALSPSMTGNPFARISSPNPTPAAAAVNGSTGNSLGSSLFTSNNGTSSTTPAPTSNGINSQPTGFGSSLFGGSSNVNQTPTSNGINSQPTGFGSSLFGTNNAGGSLQHQNQLNAQPTGMAGSTVKPFQPSSAFGSVAFGNMSTPSQQQQQQQPQTTSNNAFTGSLF